MSDAPTPPVRAESGVNSIPAIARRAPGFVRTIMIGVAGGAAFGTVLGLALPGAELQYRALVTVMVAAGFATIGGLVAGATVTRETWRHTRVDEWQAGIDTKAAGAPKVAKSPEARTR